MLVTVVVGLALITFGLALRHDPVDAPLVRLLNDTHVGTWGLAADLVYTALEPVTAIIQTVLSTVAVAVASVRRESPPRSRGPLHSRGCPSRLSNWL